MTRITETWGPSIKESIVTISQNHKFEVLSAKGDNTLFIKPDSTWKSGVRIVPREGTLTLEYID